MGWRWPRDHALCGLKALWGPLWGLDVRHSHKRQCSVCGCEMPERLAYSGTGIVILQEAEHVLEVVRSLPGPWNLVCPPQVVLRMQAAAHMCTCMRLDRKLPTEEHASDACFVSRVSRHAVGSAAPIQISAPAQVLASACSLQAASYSCVPGSGQHRQAARFGNPAST
jgi:hypothetical protein